MSLKKYPWTSIWSAVAAIATFFIAFCTGYSLFVDNGLSAIQIYHNKQAKEAVDVEFSRIVKKPIRTQDIKPGSDPSVGKSFESGALNLNILDKIEVPRKPYSNKLVRLFDKNEANNLKTNLKEQKDRSKAEEHLDNEIRKKLSELYY